MNSEATIYRDGSPTGESISGILEPLEKTLRADGWGYSYTFKANDTDADIRLGDTLIINSTEYEITSGTKAKEVADGIVLTLIVV